MRCCFNSLASVVSRNALRRGRRRQAPPQSERPWRREVVADRSEELRVVAPELLAHPVRQARAFPSQVLADARPLPQFDDRRVGRLEPSQTVRVGAQCRGQDPCVPSVVLCARRREAVPEAVELLRIDRVQHEAAFHQALDHRPARRLDRYADLARLVSRREGQQPVGHLRQPRATMLERRSPRTFPAESSMHT